MKNLREQHQFDSQFQSKPNDKELKQISCNLLFDLDQKDSLVKVNDFSKRSSIFLIKETPKIPTKKPLIHKVPILDKLTQNNSRYVSPKFGKLPIDFYTFKNKF